MAHRIEVAVPPGREDAAGQSLRRQIAEDLHIGADEVRVVRVYTIAAPLSEDELERARNELFTDPVTEISALDQSMSRDFDFLVEVGFRPGVTDNVGKSAKEGIEDLLGRKLADQEKVFTSARYAFRGVTREEAERIAQGTLANNLIEQWTLKSAEEMRDHGDAALLPLPVVTDVSDATVREIDLDLKDDALMALSREMVLALDLGEMQAIRDHYKNEVTRSTRVRLGMPADPTDIEVEILAQTWSEHCKHKIFASPIDVVVAPTAQQPRSMKACSTASSGALHRSGGRCTRG